MMLQSLRCRPTRTSRSNRRPGTRADLHVARPQKKYVVLVGVLFCLIFVRGNNVAALTDINHHAISSHIKELEGTTLADWVFPHRPRPSIPDVDVNSNQHQCSSSKYLLPSQYTSESQTQNLVPSPFGALFTSSLTTWSHLCKNQSWSKLGVGSVSHEHLRRKRETSFLYAHRVDRGKVYYLHQRKAGGDIWKGKGCGGKRGISCKEVEHLSIVGNRSALWKLSHNEYKAVPTGCMDISNRDHALMVGIIRNPITRWESEMTYSSVISKLAALSAYLKVKPEASSSGDGASMGAALRALRGWMNSEGVFEICKSEHGGEIRPNCYYNNYLVRYFTPKQCDCERNGCLLDLFSEVTEQDYIIAREQAANFHALLPLELLACDETNAAQLLRSIGLNITNNFSFPHSHVTVLASGSQKSRRFYDIPEILKVFEDDNKWDLLLYDFIINELYPSYFCHPPLTHTHLNRIPE